MINIKLENFGEDLWYAYRARFSKLILLKILWFAMAVIGGMATQELLKARWTTSFNDAFGEVGKVIATLASFAIGFLFALVPEGSITTFIAGSNRTGKDERRAWIGSIISIMLSISACLIFISKQGFTETTGFAIVMSFTGQIFILMLSSSLKDAEKSDAITEKEEEMKYLRGVYRKKRLQKYEESKQQVPTGGNMRVSHRTSSSTDQSKTRVKTYKID